LKVQVVEANLDDPEHAQALVDLIDSYARGPGGQLAPLTSEARANLVPGLRRHPLVLALLALADGDFAGAAVCFWGFSTFAGKLLLNIHDLVVFPQYQNRGIGSDLLTQAERLARERGCCKLTLEVHDTNADAKRLYEKLGFGPWSPTTIYVTKRL
jgi:ribosomal protein S18 acetylase RimI-like enzyme